MNNLKDYDFLPVYFKTRTEIYEEFYKPCMESSVQYDRITGYFGSSIFLIINKALKTFVTNSGHIRIICSPILSDEDIAAIKDGYYKVSEHQIEQNMNATIDQLNNEFPKATELLSNLISSGYLEIKLAIYLGNQQVNRLMHDKAGIFVDRFHNAVAFRGSFNETFKGLSEFGNSESFDVDTSWGEPKERVRVNMVIDQFTNMWNGTEDGIITLDIPNTTSAKIRGFRTDRLVDELCEETRIELWGEKKKSPIIDLQYTEFVIGEKVKINVLNDDYMDHSWSITDDIAFFESNNTMITSKSGKTRIFLKSTHNGEVLDYRDIEVVKWGAEPGAKRRKIRSFQQIILDNWEASNRIGLFNMATGSGKTFTAMCAIREAVFVRNEIPVIIVPRNILFEQWESEINLAFDNDVFIYKYGNNNNDLGSLKLASTQTSYKKIILATMQTASKEEFLSLINHGKHLMIVVDEVHNVGANTYSNILSIDSGSRIGLSATPKRYRDPIGTDKIMDYFISEIPPKYTLVDAIRDNVLCEYYYYPMVVNLGFSESIAYQEITDRISQRYAILKTKGGNDIDIFNDSIIKNWLIKRSDIVKKAESKIDVAYKTINDKYIEGQRWLVYCDDIEQLDAVYSVLISRIPYKFHNNLHKYHSKSWYKDEVLTSFELNGGILLSINCLDEGVDIPSIDHALILSSSQNERQFIQRRGRVLRRYKSKMHSHIFDAIVSPDNLEKRTDVYPFVKYEIMRSIIFAKNAVNKGMSLMAINELAINQGIDIDTLISEERGFEDE